MSPDEPRVRPLERFWPYTELSEQPTDEELARLHPDLREALFGAPPRPFSISIVFPAFDGPRYERAVTLAKAGDEYTEWRSNGVLYHRARFSPGDRPLRLRDLYEAVDGINGVDVLVNDQAVPAARELWLPLVWFLIK